MQKQGVLPLWLVDKSDYAKISASDKVQTSGLTKILGGSATSDRVTLHVKRPNGEQVDVQCRHTLSKDQVEWLREGSALNWIGKISREKAARV